MVAQHSCYSELPKSLDFLTTMWTSSPRYSDYNAADDMSLWTYNGMDCAVTWECMVELEAELKEEGLWEFYKNHAEPVMLGLCKMSNAGVLVDQERLSKFKQVYEGIKQGCIERIEKLTGMHLNPRSPKQMKQFLYEKLGLPEKRVQGKVSTNEDSVLALARENPEHKEILDEIIAYRKASNVISKVLSQKLSPEGRMHCQYHATGAVTGRISSSKYLFELGMNLQNVFKSPLRRLFIPSPGNVFIKVDGRQAEAITEVWLINCRRLIEKYLDDPSFDIYKWNASENLYKVPVEEITKEQRSRAKIGILGGNYQMGPGTAAKTYDVPFHEAKFALNAYINGMPELRQFWEWVQTEITFRGWMTNPFGRRRVFLDRRDNSTFRSGYAQLPQSTVGDLVNRAVFMSDLILAQHGCIPRLQVHDEIVFEVAAVMVETVVPLIRNIFEYPLQIKGVPEPLVIPCDIEVGYNWWDVKDWGEFQEEGMNWGELRNWKKPL